MTPVKAFLLMGVVGMIIGLIFDIFRAFRISFRGTGKRFDYILAQITDVIFVLAAFCLFTVGLYVFADGMLRGYCILGAIMGLLIYMLIFAPVLGKIFRLIFIIFYKIFIELPKKLFTKGK